MSAIANKSDDFKQMSCPGRYRATLLGRLLRAYADSLHVSLLLLLLSLTACGGGASDVINSAAAANQPVRYDGDTLVVKGVSFGPQKAQDYCVNGSNGSNGTSATQPCYQTKRVGVWVRKSNTMSVDADVLLFGLRVIERLVYECAGNDREFWVLDVPAGFELQWLLALRLFLTIVSSLILPSPIAPSDPFNDPAQVISFVCQFARV